MSFHVKSILGFAILSISDLLLSEFQENNNLNFVFANSQREERDVSQSTLTLVQRGTITSRGLWLCIVCHFLRNNLHRKHEPGRRTASRICNFKLIRCLKSQSILGRTKKNNNTVPAQNPNCVCASDFDLFSQNQFIVQKWTSTSAWIKPCLFQFN